MKKNIVCIILALAIVGSISWYVLFGRQTVKTVEKNLSSVTASLSKPKSETVTRPAVHIKKPPEKYEIPSKGFVSQTFNNCGPASLSMVMRYFGKDVSQDELREQMRPFNNPAGGVDDKSVFANEFVTYAEKYGLQAMARPNGTPELIKLLIANDIPVVVRTWLHPGEDIGHFRIVRGYDDARQVFIQDDSYQGANLTYSYDEFNSMWQPFNYGYIVVYSPEKAAVVEAILGKNMDENTAYQQSIARAEKEIDANPAYANFNLSTAYYHVGDYKKAVEYYEKAQSIGLPSRMLWYQIEPIQAYLKTGQYDKVFSLTDSILNNGNLAYSELYYLRGQAYLAQNDKEAARGEFETAIKYNKNYSDAQAALTSL